MHSSVAILFLKVISLSSTPTRATSMVSIPELFLSSIISEQKRHAAEIEAGHFLQVAPNGSPVAEGGIVDHFEYLPRNYLGIYVHGDRCFNYSLICNAILGSFVTCGMWRHLPGKCNDPQIQVARKGDIEIASIYT